MPAVDNYARPAPPPQKGFEPRVCAKLHAYVFFAGEYVPAEVLAAPGEWCVHHIPAGYEKALEGVRVVGVGPDTNGGLTPGIGGES